MPCENLALYSYIFTPRNTLPSTSVSSNQNLAAAALFARADFEGQHDRHAGANQHERVEGADRLAQVHLVRPRPGQGTEAQHDVRADQAGEEHDLGREEQPHDQLAVGERQAGLVLELRGGRDRVAVTVRVGTS